MSRVVGVVAVALVACSEGSTSDPVRDASVPADARVVSESQDSGTSGPALDAGGGDASVPDGAPAADGEVPQPAAPRVVSGPVPAAELIGGTRLRPRVVTSAEGLRVHQDFWDTALGLSCDFSSDYCLPTEFAQRYYLASDCTDPVIVWTRERSEACVLPLLTVEPDDLCFQGRRAVRATERVVSSSANATVYYRDSEGQCITTERPGVLHRFEELPLSDFVALRETLHAGDGRLKARYRRAEDGSQFRDGWFDGEFGVPCVPARADDGAQRCVPSGLGVLGPSPFCPLELTYVSQHCGEAPEQGYAAVQQGLGFTVIRVSDPTGPACTSAPGAAAYRQRTRIDPASVPPLTSAQQGGRTLSLQGSGSAGLPDSYPKLTYLDVVAADEPDCQPAPDRDGTLRCMPAGSNSLECFADVDCQTPIVALQNDGHAVAYDHASLADCSQQPRLRVYEPGTPLAAGAATYRRNVEGRCVQGEPAVAATLALGVEIAPDVYPELKRDTL